MIVVYIDTNALYKHPHFTAPPDVELLAAAAAGAVEVRISPVVWGELKRQEREHIQEAREAVANTVARRALGGLIDKEELTQKVVQPLNDLLDQIDAQFADTASKPNLSIDSWPGVSVQDLVTRELEVRRPSLEIPYKGERASIGFRDVVIWEGARSILRESDEVTLILVTDDHGFLNEKKTDLHGHLKSDLATDGVAPDRVLTARSIAIANLRIKEVLREITSLRASVTSAFLSSLIDLQGLSVGWSLGYSGDFEPGLLDEFLQGSFDNAVIEAVDGVGEPRVSGDTTFTIEQDVWVTVSGGMNLADWYGTTNVELWGSVNDHYVDVGTTIPLTIRGTFRVEEGEAHLVDELEFFHRQDDLSGPDISRHYAD